MVTKKNGDKKIQIFSWNFLTYFTVFFTLRYFFYLKYVSTPLSCQLKGFAFVQKTLQSELFHHLLGHRLRGWIMSGHSTYLTASWRMQTGL